MSRILGKFTIVKKIVLAGWQLLRFVRGAVLHAQRLAEITLAVP
jgi:hypothetical protein